MSISGQPSRVSQLQQAVRESRLSISQEYKGLLDDLDLKKKIATSLKHHPLRWVGGAAVAGLIATFFGSRNSSSFRPSPAIPSPAAAPRAGWIVAALEVGRLLYPVLRPVVVEWIGNATRSSLGKRGFPR